MFKRIFLLACLSAFLVISVGCENKEPTAQDHQGKTPTESTNENGSTPKTGDSGERNGTVGLTD